MSDRSDETRITQAASGDLDRLMPLLVALRREDSFDCQLDESRTRAALTQLLASRDNGIVWIIEVDGTVAGFLACSSFFSLEFGGRVTLLDELYVVADYRGRGLATKLIEKARDWSTTRHHTAMLLEVSPGNEPAKRCYSRAGFAGRSFDTLTLILD